MKLIVRLKGGVGNQLYSYAAAKRLSIANGAELVIDNVSGFARDKEYRRSYGLDRFNITARLAETHERFVPFERPRRALAKFLAKHQPFETRKYIEQENDDFDVRLLSIKLAHEYTTIDGLWQSELYFKDVENEIRNEFKISPPTDYKNLAARDNIKLNRTTAIHVRWFNPGSSNANASEEYYKRAIQAVRNEQQSPKFAIFSDNPRMAANILNIRKEESILVDWNNEDGAEIDDLWLMSNCSDFIIANSTFSWWAAWLGSNDKSETCVYFPRETIRRRGWAWDYYGQMPDNWMPVLS